MIKLKNLIEGVQENKEIYELADLILNEFSKIPEDKLFDTSIRLSKYNSHGFKYVNIITNRDVEVEISGDKSYYSGLYKLIRLSEREYLAADVKPNEVPDLKKIYNHILVHELQHAYDDIRSSGKYIQDKQSQTYYNSKYKSEYSYLRLPHEVWARFAEFAEHLSYLNRKSDIVRLLGGHLRGWEYLDETMKRRIMKAAYKLHQDKIQDYRNKKQ